MVTALKAYSGLETASRRRDLQLRGPATGTRCTDEGGATRLHRETSCALQGTRVSMHRGPRSAALHSRLKPLAENAVHSLHLHCFYAVPKLGKHQRHGKATAEQACDASAHRPVIPAEGCFCCSACLHGRCHARFVIGQFTVQL